MLVLSLSVLVRSLCHKLSISFFLYFFNISCVYVLHDEIILYLFTVVTGSSEGIGLAYAKELANRGLNIVMISRGENKLYRAAKDIGILYTI